MNYCATKTVYEMTNPHEDSFYKDLPNKSSDKLPVHEVDFVNHERLILIQSIVFCVKTSLDFSPSDSYLQFNSLILLDNLF
jgi:hypothetical protein